MHSASGKKHPLLAVKGGINITDKNENFKDLVVDILKEVGEKIMTGGSLDFLKLEIPAKLNYPETHHHSLMNDFSYTDYLIEAAKETDPVTRVKLVLTFLVGGLFVCPAKWKTKAPLNPILGETLQRYQENGCCIYVEQTSITPPTVNYYLKGPDGLFELFGFLSTQVKMTGINSVTGTKIGRSAIRFKDGSLLTYVSPDMEMEGMLMGERIFNFNGSVNVKDYKNKIEAHATFFNNDFSTNQEVKNIFKRVIHDDEKKIMLDDLIIMITKFNKQTKKKEIVGEGHGSWLGEVFLDGKKVWDIDHKFPEWSRDLPEPTLRLPSDSDSREAIIELKKDCPDYALAQKLKKEDTARDLKDLKLRKK